MSGTYGRHWQHPSKEGDGTHCILSKIPTGRALRPGMYTATYLAIRMRVYTRALGKLGYPWRPWTTTRNISKYKWRKSDTITSTYKSRTVIVRDYGQSTDNRMPKGRNQLYVLHTYNDRPGTLDSSLECAPLVRYRLRRDEITPCGQARLTVARTNCHTR